MTTTAFDDQYTTAPEPVRQPYDTAAILRRNVAELELALKQQTDRAEAAEAELARLREQEPLTWGTSGELMDILKNPIYSSPAPVPAPAVSAANPAQWLEDEGDMILVPRGLLGAACSSIDKQRPAPKVLEAMRHYTMNAPQAPAVPTNTIPEGDDFNGTTPHMIRCIESLVAMNDRGALAPHGLCGHSRTLLLASANRLRQQQAHVVPAVPDDDSLVNLVYKHFYTEKDQSCLLHDVGPYELTEPRPALRDFARALLQSAEVKSD